MVLLCDLVSCCGYELLIHEQQLGQRGVEDGPVVRFSKWLWV